MKDIFSFLAIFLSLIILVGLTLLFGSLVGKLDRLSKKMRSLAEKMKPK